MLSRESYWQFFSKTVLTKDKIEDINDLHYRLVRPDPAGYIYLQSDAPFYSLFNIGDYTFAKTKVVWPRMANDIKAAVVDDLVYHKVIIPTDTVAFIPCKSSSEAHYLCGLLNSKIVRSFVKSFSSAGRGFAAPSIIQNIGIPEFNLSDGRHVGLEKLSRNCHNMIESDQSDLVKSLEGEIDELALKMWGNHTPDMKKVY